MEVVEALWGNKNVFVKINVEKQALYSTTLLKIFRVIEIL